ncbi:MAG: hypothetical protein ACQEP3_00190 [Patescibacteria group bacterium]
MLDQLIDLIFVFGLLFFVSYYTAYFWRKIFQGRKYSVIVFPGVIIHELSHIIACIITFAKIKEVKLFSFQGGFVRHKKPKLPIIGTPIISFFPVIGGTAALFLIYWIYGIELSSFSVNRNFIQGFKNLLVNNWNNLYFWILIYLSISIIISICPSKKDFKNSIYSLLILFIGLLFLSELGIITSIPFIQELRNVIYFSSLIGCIVMILSGAAYLIKLFVVKLVN